MMLLIVIVNISVLATIAYFFWRREKIKIYWVALIFKLLCGIAVGIIYKYYYTVGDTWTFFQDAREVMDYLQQHPDKILSFLFNDELADSIEIDDQPRSLFFIKWVSIFSFIAYNNYWISSLYFSLISFLGSWYGYRVLVKFFPALKMEALLATLFIPSMMFWSSGIIKESLAFGFMMLISGVFLEGYKTKSISLFKIILLLLASWWLWNLKYYWLGVWLAVVGPVIVISFLGQKFPLLKKYPRLSWLILLVAALFLASVLHPNFYWHRIMAVIVQNNEAFMELSEPGDAIHFYALQPTVISMLVNAPWALVSGIFRPFLFEAHNFLQAGVSLENSILLVLLTMAIVNFKTWYQDFDLLRLAAITYIILLSIFLALSTPNFGTLSRYKIGFTPFLWFMALAGSGIMHRFRKLESVLLSR